MDKQLPKELSDQQIKALQSIIFTMTEDISVIEKIVGRLILEADQKKLIPVITFCHDVLQSLHLIPIYARNIIKKLPDSVGGNVIIEDNAIILLQGLLSITKESLIRPKSKNGDPENLFAIMSVLCLHQDYSAFGIEQEVARIHIRAVKLHQLAISLRQVLDLD
jgi:hypothetical protein